MAAQDSTRAEHSDILATLSKVTPGYGAKRHLLLLWAQPAVYRDDTKQVMLCSLRQAWLAEKEAMASEKTTVLPANTKSRPCGYEVSEAERGCEVLCAARSN